MVRATGADGAVELARTLEEPFDGTVLPAGWSHTPWVRGRARPTVAGGAMLVNGTRADSGVTARPRQLDSRIRATLGSPDFRPTSASATDFDGPAVGDVQHQLRRRRRRRRQGLRTDVRRRWRRTQTSTPRFRRLSRPIAHTYRIDWTATGFEYFVDGAPVATHPIPMTAGDARAGQRLRARTPGGRLDRVHGPQHAQAVRHVHLASPRRRRFAGDRGLSFTATSTGTAIAYETRTATSAAALASADWAPLSASGAVTSPRRATCSTARRWTRPSQRQRPPRGSTRSTSSSPSMTWGSEGHDQRRRGDPPRRRG